MRDAIGSLPKRGVKRVTIEGLFGHYDYGLPGNDDGFSEVVIFYGDNGSGKTTLLRLLFHLLSAAGNRGHRTAISEVAFKRIEVELHDGTKLSAYRDHGEGVEETAYTVRCEPIGQVPFELTFDPKSEPNLQPKDLDATFHNFLGSLDLTLYFLSADREILSDELPKEEAEDEWMALKRFRAIELPGLFPRKSDERPLRRAMRGAVGWISRQAVQGTNVGSGSANHIYEQIVTRIADSAQSVPTDESADAQTLAHTLRELGERSEQFSQFQLTSPLVVASLIRHLSESPPTTRSIIARVLEPYVQGTTARLDALVDVQRITEAFVRNCNQFFTDKELSFNISKGIQITGRTGRPLDPSQLSSGEQQLLLLFCHMIVSRDRATIFIIDEPELSLNVKWQRKLIGALLELVRGSEIQFVFATHSLELLAQHRGRVVPLRPIVTASHPL